MDGMILQILWDWEEGTCANLFSNAAILVCLDLFFSAFFVFSTFFGELCNISIVMLITSNENGWILIKIWFDLYYEVNLVYEICIWFMVWQEN